MSSTKLATRRENTMSECSMSPSSPKLESTTNLGKELGHQIVTITVGTGSEAKVFALHKSLLCSKATYFKNMFMGSFGESFSHSASFPEDSPEAFELFVSWLYLDVVQVPDENPTISSLDVLIHLYAFAEKCVITRLADHTMNTLTRLAFEREEKLEPYQMKLAYDLTPQYSSLRTFVAKMCVYVILEDDDVEVNNVSWNVASLLQAFRGYDDLLCDVLTFMKGKSGKVIRDPRLASVCDYHCHTAAEVCPYDIEKSSASTSRSKKRILKKASTPSPKKRYSLR